MGGYYKTQSIAWLNSNGYYVAISKQFLPFVATILATDKQQEVHPKINTFSIYLH